MRRWTCSLSFVAATVFQAFLLSHTVFAQSPRLEVWGGVTLATTPTIAPLTTDYVPSIQSYSPSLPGSTAGQTITLLTSGHAGLGGGVNLFFSPHAGVQFLIDSGGRALEGTSTDYSVLLNYTARQPPDYVERQYSSSRTFTACDAAQAWGCVPPTTGSLRQTTLGFNLVGRWPAGKRVNVELSGGLSYEDLRGDGQALRYTSYRMGGHSTLFSEEYQLAYSVGPAHGFGMNVGGTVDAQIRPGLAFTVDARYFGGGDIAAPLVVTEVINKDTIVFLEDPATIQQNLHPPDMQVSPSHFRVLVGVKVRR